MPLTKAQKALYEAALKRKGLPQEKMFPAHVTRNTYGPFRTERGYAKHPYLTESNGGPTSTEVKTVPMDTYWGARGRYQDLEDEIGAAIESGRYERKSPFAHEYYRYYNDGDFPRGATRQFSPDADRYGYNYDDQEAYFYDYPAYGSQRRALTGLGEMELEAITDANIVEDYKNYLRQMYSGKIAPYPKKYGVRVWDRFTHKPLVSEYDDLESALKGLRRNRADYGSAYLEEIPEE